MPHSPAGPRIEPPVSEPRLAGTNPAATAAPDPDDEPPVKCAVFHGLRAGGHGKSNDGPPSANSCVDVLPISTVPASASFTAQVASLSGTLSRRILEWQVVVIPLVSTMSFNPIGMPHSGPTALPFITAASAARAS